MESANRYTYWNEMKSNQTLGIENRVFTIELKFCINTDFFLIPLLLRIQFDCEALRAINFHWIGKSSEINRVIDRKEKTQSDW